LCFIDATRLGKKEMPAKFKTRGRWTRSHEEGGAQDRISAEIDTEIVWSCRAPQTSPHKFQTAKMRYYRYIWQQSKPNTQIYTVASVDWNEEEKNGVKQRIFKHYTTFYTNVKSNSKERTRMKMKKNWNPWVVNGAVF